MVWNARSHAAYQGYSHLSGIEMMCWFTMWNHSLFRMKRPPGFIGSTPCSSSHLSTSKTEILLGPEHSGQRLAHDEGLVFADTLRSDGLVELIGLALTGLHDFSEALEGIAHGSRRQVAQPQTDGGRLSCAHIQLIVCGRLSFPCSRD